jgi:hypothetical protein
MNKKGLITYMFVFGLILFIILWVFMLAPILSVMGNTASGFLSDPIYIFFLKNLNLWLFFGVIIFIVVYANSGGSQ